MPRLLRRLMNLLLLPLALLMVVLEDVVWAGALFVLRAVRRAGPVRAVEAWLGTLSGYAALPLFLVLEIVGFAGKIWAIGLVASGHPVAGLEAYVVIRLGSTLLAVFVYQACSPALLRIGWFARLVHWVHVARDNLHRIPLLTMESVRCQKPKRVVNIVRGRCRCAGSYRIA